MSLPAAGRWALVVLTLGGCAGQPLPPSMAVPDGAAVVMTMPSPLEVLEGAAGDEEPWMRGRALAALVRTDPSPAGGLWGPRGLWDPDPWVRRQVLEALGGRMAEPETVQLLVGHLRQASAPGGTRAAAAMALHRAGHRDLLPELAAMASGATGWDRLPLSLAAAQAGDGASIARLRDEILPGGDFPLDLGLVEDLAQAGVPELAAGVVAGLELAEVEAELMMAVALVGLGHPEGGRRVDAALAAGGIAGLEVVDLLALCPPEAAQEHVRRARKASDDDVSRMADLLAVAHGWAKPEVAFAVLASEAPAEAQARAMQALGHVDDPHARRLARVAARDHLSDPDPQVREAAARLLGILGRASDARLLEANLVDESSIVRIVAAEALRSLRPRSGPPEGGAD